MSHTPGPWRFEPGKWNTPEHEQGGHSRGSIVNIDENGDVGYYIARIDNADGEEYNARLIAAAPDLLEALIYVRDHICDPERGLREIYPAFGLDAGNAVRLVKSAIAKAEGLS